MAIRNDSRDLSAAMPKKLRVHRVEKVMSDISQGIKMVYGNRRFHKGADARGTDAGELTWKKGAWPRFELGTPRTQSGNHRPLDYQAYFNRSRVADYTTLHFYLQSPRITPENMKITTK